MQKILANLGKNEEFGQVLRAKGIVPGLGNGFTSSMLVVIGRLTQPPLNLLAEQW
ncbi:hypothetical protein N752_09305 [Desulforamulus aquiferis]|nr:hypothetical protein [Desulforamulus aquiferis]RYD05533.1 hypothetical protein N752_09305 [Desulforamulus aquiferis]